MANSISVSIPEKWQAGAYQIKGFIQHYAEAVGQCIIVNVASETTPNEIWVADAGSLTQPEYEAADNAIQMLNHGLNRVKGDPWNVKADAENVVGGRLAELEKIVRKPG